MKFNKWTVGLAAVGAVSLTSAAKADETVSFVQTLTTGTVIGGYVDTSVEWRADSPHNFTFGSFGSLVGGVPFRNGGNPGGDKQNGFNLNAVGVTISKSMDETPWASGFNFQLIYGPDAVGFNPVENGGTGSGFSIKNANVVLRVPVGNGLDIKIGVFDTIIGYEVFESGNNPNFTRSYGYGLEPTEHTGVLFTYHFNDNVSVSAGVANTLSAGINSRDTSRGDKSFWNKTGMASITLTAPQTWGWLAGSSFSLGGVYGFDEALNDASDNLFNNRLNLYAGWTIPTPVKGLAIGGAFDYTTAAGKTSNPGYGGYFNETMSGDAYSFALYGSWQVTEKASLHVRGEYVHGNASDSTTRFDSFTGFDVDRERDHTDADIFALTGTLQYNLWANVISRLEIRYDHICTETREHFIENGIPDGSSKFTGKDDQLWLALNVIYKF